jgi:hypothetical protein
VAVVIASLPARVPGVRFLGLVATAPLALVIARLLPADGVGLALRLFAASLCVLIVPGALLVRSIGWPESLGLAVAASFALSLVVVFFALTLVFAAQASLTLAIVVIAGVSLGAVAPAALAPAAPVDRRDLLAVAGVVVAGFLFALLVWWAGRTLGGDGIFHAARAEKIAELPTLSSVNSVDEFRDGGLHPGYAFPLWHAAMALVSRLAGVDVVTTFVKLPAALVPLAFLLAYAAGRELFRSWAGGIAVSAGQLALLGLGRDAPGSFAFLSLPATVSRLLLPMALLALGFAYIWDGDRRLLVPLSGGALALAAVHPTYAIFVAFAFAGFILALLILTWSERASVARGAVALGAITVPALLFFVWLLPAVRGAASVTPGPAQKARDIAHYSGYLEGTGHLLRIAPDAVARRGPAFVAALLLIPLAGLAARRLWAAYVLGASLAVFAVLMLPFVFSTFADAVSLSQARRLISFLPLAFALAGGAVLAGRLRLAGVAAGAALGAGLAWAYPGEFTYRVHQGGPGWTVYLAIFGGLAALGLGAWLRPWGPDAGPWAALAALAFAVTVAVSAIGHVHRQPRDPRALTPGVITALRANVRRGQVIFGDVDAIYRAAAYVPAYISAAPPAHVAVNAKNRPRRRRGDTNRFFDPGTTPDVRQQLLERYGARWLLLDWAREKRPSVPGLQRVYADGRYALYRVSA